ncbi:hypothetical protein ACIBG4_14915 [Nonomuraea sp. NPDC050383]|uniref:hypothetical protein n=1 Tax=Nonomuraea sp. NPDC050383 TaxID=3364362 RepID=UPI00378EB018
MRLNTQGFTSGTTAVKGDLRGLNRELTTSSGFAAGFRKKLEAATAALPKIEIDADSSPAEVKLAQVRHELEKLGKQTIGVDIDPHHALMEMQRLHGELLLLEEGASFEVRAGIQQATEDLAAVEAEVRRLDGRDVKLHVDADSKEALADLGKVTLALGALGTATPVLGAVAAGAVSMGGAFAAAGAGVAGFKVVVAATMDRVKEAVESADFSKLSPEEYKLAQKWAEFSDVYLGWQRSLNPEVVPAIAGGLDLMSTTLPKISPLVAGTASSFVGLEKNAQAALNGPFWTQFLHNLGVAAPTAVSGFGNSLLNVGTGVAGIIDAFLPFTPTVVGGVEAATRAFADWGQQLDTSPEFREFVQFVKENAPEAWELVKNLASALGNVGEAVIPLGVGSMSGLNLLASIVAGMDPEHIRLIALAILAVKGAQAGLKVASFWSDLTGKLGGLGGAADTAKGKLGGLGSTLQAGGVAAAVAAIAVGADQLSDSLMGLNPNLDKLSRGLADFGAGGKPSAELLDQLKPKIAGVSNQVETLIDSAVRLTADDPFNKATNSVAGFVDSFDVVTIDNGRQAIDNVDAGLARLVEGGRPEEAARSFEMLALRASEAGVPTARLKELFPEYANAVAAAEQATAAANGSLGQMGQSAGAAAASVSTLHSALGQLVGLTTNAMSAEISYKRAVDDATAAVKTNGEATSTSTEKGRANREALINLAQSANSYRQALIDQGTPLSEVTAKLGTQRTAFIQLAEKMGFSKTQAKGLADQLGLIPGNVKTDVKTPGGKEALGLIQEYQRKLNELDGKVVSTRVRTIYDSPSGRAAIEQKNRAMGGIERYASGGVQRFAAGGKYSPPPHIATKPTILYGEGSAPEAFIPFDPKYRSRAISLLGEVAGDFGLEVYNKQAATTVTNLTTSVDGANVTISTSLDSATSMLGDTLGAAGSLTGAVSSVGEVGGQMVEAWQSGSQTVGDSVGVLGDQVTAAANLIVEAATKLRDAAMDVAGAIGQARTSSTSSKSKSKSGTGGSEGSIIPPKPGTGGSEGSVIPPKPGSKASSTGRGSLGSVIPPAPAPHGGSLGSVIPPAPGRGSLGSVIPPSPGATNHSRVSAPQRMSASMIAPMATADTGGSAASSGSGAAGRSGSLINVENLNVTNRADADATAAYLYARLGSKGP